MIDRRKILEEIAAAHRIRQRREWEFTRREFAEVANTTYERAKRVLDKKVEAGELMSEDVNVDGRRARVYWRPEDVPSAEFV